MLITLILILIAFVVGVEIERKFKIGDTQCWQRAQQWFGQQLERIGALLQHFHPQNDQNDGHND